MFRKPGENVFYGMLVAFSAFSMIQSLGILQKKPGMDGPATVPLLASSVLFFCTLFGLLRSVRQKCEKQETVSHYLFPLPVIEAIIAILLYCLLLGIGVSFWVVTPVFLFGLMSVYEMNHLFRNLLWTALCTGFLYLVFSLLFRVMIP